jgi:hypothetical protein
MGGGILQLVAYGAQDLYLTNDAEITFFKMMYKRHSNFSMESIQQNFNGIADFGRKVSATISRNGDLVHTALLEVDLPTLTSTGTAAWARNIGHVLIKEVEVSIGGQKIDKHYGQFLHIWQELTQQKGHEDTYNVMIGNTTELTTEAASIPAAKLQIPLQFWFNKFIGLSLPLIALSFHEVKIDIEFRPFSECHVSSSGTVTIPALTNASLWVNYIFLDTDERKNFAQASHEYLIEQLQFTGAESFSQTAVKQRLSFNHPCKEMIWVAQLDNNVNNVATSGGNANRWTDFTDNGAGANPYNGADTIVDAKLQLNGHDRFATRSASYFNLVQPYYHHSRGPSTGVYCYSFALKPEEHQPSGSINMSRIDNTQLQLTMASSAACKLYTYAINYNVLRIRSGMGGLAFAN